MQIVMLCFFLFNIGFAGQNSEQITLKNGRTYDFTVSKVDSWGVMFSGNKACMYKHFKEIRTHNSYAVSQIFSMFPELIVKLEPDSVYVLDFSNVIVNKLEQKDNRLLDRFSILLLSTISSSSNNEIRFSLKPKNMSNFVYEIGYLSDWYFGNYDKPSNNTSGFSLGFGIDKKIEVGEVSLLLNYLYQTGMGLRARNKIQHESLFSTLNARLNITDTYLLIFTWNYYFDKVKVRRDYRQSLFNIGMGLNLY